MLYQHNFNVEGLHDFHLLFSSLGIGNVLLRSRFNVFSHNIQIGRHVYEQLFMQSCKIVHL